MGRVNGVADPRLHFETKDERVQEIAARNVVGARVSEQRGRHRYARMDVVLGRRVVVLVDVRADTVEKRRMQRIEGFAPAEHACSGFARERCERLDGDIERGFDAAAHGATEVIQYGALRFPPDIFGNG